MRELWPQFFVGQDNHWNLLEEATCSVDTYNAAFKRELKSYNLRDQFKNLSVPMLLIVGASDSYRGDMEWLAEHAPNATLCVLDRAGHFPFVEAEKEFLARVSTFLAHT